MVDNITLMQNEMELSWLEINIKDLELEKILACLCYPITS